jgi:hypothetical protein
MKFEPKKIDWIGSPVKQEDGSYKQQTIISIGIVGNTYEGFINQKTLIVIWPATGKNAEQIEASIKQQVDSFVQQIYPEI